MVYRNLVLQHCWLARWPETYFLVVFQYKKLFGYVQKREKKREEEEGENIMSAFINTPKCKGPLIVFYLVDFKTNNDIDFIYCHFFLNCPVVFFSMLPISLFCVDY
jgi:hypothetical protein